MVREEVSKRVTDPTLKNLAKQLPCILLAARAENTRAKYQCYFHKFDVWCKLFLEIKSYPTKDIHVSLYIAGLIQPGESVSVIESSFYAIKWYHSFLDPNPCNTKLCTTLLEAARRICKKPLKKENSYYFREFIYNLEENLLAISFKNAFDDSY